MKMDDLLIFMMLEKHRKLTEMLQFGRIYLFILRFILNTQVELQ